MDVYRRLLLANRVWAKQKLEVDPRYFEGLAQGQDPDFLWIGCSDSRVPPDEITGCGPGEIFAHRNVANAIGADDPNAMAVLQYAVEHLKVKHVIVCGHYRCGGVEAVLKNSEAGTHVDRWLNDRVRPVYDAHQGELELHTDFQRRWDRLVELNVMEQVQNLSRTAVIRNAWREHMAPVLHGWVFDLAHGKLTDLIEVQPDALHAAVLNRGDDAT